MEISLSDYNLTSVPSDIEVLRGVQKLYIRKDNKGWTIYPPMSALEPGGSVPKTPGLPDKIGELISLTSLSLSGLGLRSLPDNFRNLVNLDSLFLFANRLTVSKEIDKIGRFKSLKFLGLLGNDLSAADLVQLHKLLPNVVIDPELR